jgi:hypothetical protein
MQMPPKDTPKKPLASLKAPPKKVLLKVGDQRVGSYSRTGYQERVQFCSIY